MTQEQQPAKPSLYQRLIAAGVPVSNWQSDLYFPATPQTQQIIREAMEDGVVHSRPTVFQNQVDGGRWYDAPFLFDPFWQKREVQHAVQH